MCTAKFLIIYYKSPICRIMLLNQTLYRLEFTQVVQGELFGVIVQLVVATMVGTN